MTMLNLSLSFQAYKATAFEKHTTTALVADARVKYTVWDTTGKKRMMRRKYVNFDDYGSTNYLTLTAPSVALPSFVAIYSPIS
jgi:hypothetical protein